MMRNLGRRASKASESAVSRVSHPARPDKLPSMAHNKSSRRFEIRVGDDTWAFPAYSFEGNCIVLEHTFVPAEFHGQGIAANLVRAALDEARQRRLKIIPRCSYGAEFLRGNREFADLVAQKARP